MASFTDEISKFNPYVAQLPAEAMVKVGMYKQAQYDAGVQKIQSYMDNIAGMDLYNEGDKQYVQSKLNELGDNLKVVAAGDFSNQQLVNSVGGMATQIVKDPHVQNALTQTAQFRKTLARIEKDQAEGKAGANNIEDFYAQAKPWMESKTPGTKLQANYSQYRDVNKSALEIIKGLHSNLKSVDIPFVVENGKINMSKIADAMKRNKVEGVTEGQIVTALRAGLSAEDYNQLAIDGRATFRNVSGDKLNYIVDKTLNTNKDQNGLEVLKLRTELPSQVQDPNKTDEINRRLEWYKNQGFTIKDAAGNVIESVKGDLDNQADEDYKLIQTDPNKVKESLYKQGFFQQFGNGFKWNNEDFSYQKNPLKEQENWIKDMELKWATENRLKKQSDRDYVLAVKKDAREEAKERREAEEYNGAPGIPVEEGNATDNVLKSSERLQNHMTSVANQVVGMKKSLLDKGYTDAQVNGMIADYQKNGNKANVPATEIGTIQDILKQQQYFNDLKKMDATAKAEAEKEIMGDKALQDKKAKSESYVKANFSPNVRIINGAYKGGPTLNMSEKELFDGIKSGKISYHYDKAPLGYVYVNANGHEYQFAKSGVYTNPKFKELIEKVIDYNAKFGKIDKDIDTKIDNLYKEKLAPRVTELVPTVTGMGFGKDGAVPTKVANNLVAFIGAAAAKEIAADENFDADTASKRLTGDNLKNTKVLLRQTADGYQAIIRDLTDIKDDQVININQNQAIAIFGKENVNTNKQDALRIRAGRGSNNVNGSPASAPMQVQFGDFPNINHYQLTAQLDEDTKYKDQFVPKVHLLKKDGTYQTFEISGKNRAQRVGYDQGKQQLSNLTDDTMMKLLKELYPTYDFSQIYRK